MKKGLSLLLICIFSALQPFAQKVDWDKDGNSFYQQEQGEIVKYTLPAFDRTVIVSAARLTPAGASSPVSITRFAFSADNTKVLIVNNTKKVWRYDTRGDCWVLNLTTGKLGKIGKTMPPSSIMFPKFSPDGTRVAYVSGHNIYTEDLATGSTKALTTNGTSKLINGTFDWAYEEEFFCRDGFRWSPDSRQIAYWQINASTVKNYLMLDNTDSLYPFTKPVEYPVAGEAPSPFKIGVVNVSTVYTQWMDIPTDPVLQSYVPRMEWADNSTELIVQHMNRRQNQSDLLLCNVASGKATTIYKERDSAWIDVLSLWDDDYSYGGWDWLNNGKDFLWASEKDGWRHLYIISRDGKKETLVTKGNYDVMDISAINEKSGYVYFFASPDNATQKYLYRTRLDGSGTAERLSPAKQPGTHNYSVSPTGAFAVHSFSNYYTPQTIEWITLPAHKPIMTEAVDNALGNSNANKASSNLRFFTVKAQGTEMDAWMVKPADFDSTKKYPIVFFVYTEPWGQNVKDQYGIASNKQYNGSMANDGYIYVSIDNRGTPVPKGRAWRKSIYRNLGIVNISDQAMAAKEILKLPYIDTSRVAVWGWSGGGSATLNLMFQYPQIYKTGIAIAGISDLHTYDNIYEERYMGLPQEAGADYTKGSPLTYAKNLQGNLLYIHGTADDNVHYSNAELLINELVKYNKPFQLMSYPNRTHAISEGAGTSKHLATIFTNYLHQYCPPGGR